MDDAPFATPKQRIRAARPRPSAQDWHLPDDAPDPFATPPPRPRVRGRIEDETYARDARDASDASLPKLTLPTIPALPRAPAWQEPRGETGRNRTLLTTSTGRMRAEAPHRQSRAEASAPTGPRVREHTSARPLAALSRSLMRERFPFAHERSRLPAPLPRADVLDVTAYRGVSRPRSATQALVRTARNPWSVARLILALCAISVAMVHSLSAAGEPGQPLMATFLASAGARDSAAITSRVRPETQGMRPDLYDSQQQFEDWWDAACSAAVMSETLTAWGEKGATIGHMIDMMQPDISLNGGLLRAEGFQRGAAAYHFRADLSWHLSYKQLLYITNTLGLPVIVNVRIAYGYYHFFDTGHFLVVTGGDAAGLKIVDSSEYYVTYLPLDTFMSMFTGMTAVVVPNGYTYSVP